MSDQSPLVLWQSIPNLERDATLMGPTRNLAGEYQALAGDLVVKSESVLPLIGRPDIQLKTTMRPLTSTTSHGLDPIAQTSSVSIRNSNQNPAAAGVGPGGAIWRNGGSSGAPVIWKQGERVSFLDGLPITPMNMGIAAAIGLAVWFLTKKA
jgi:hypothetical protein